MKLAVMQPYVFSYIGYFQLVHAVDVFVFYDDVNYFKGGWVNRNKILINGDAFIFTLPLKKASSFTMIKDTELHPKLYNKWVEKFLKSLEQAYKKAPNFEVVFPLVGSILKTPTKNIAGLAQQSVVEISRFLGFKTEFKTSSIHFSDSKGMEKADRLLAICKKTKAGQYINPIGGQELYFKDHFEKQGVQLNFIQSLPIEYKQFKNEFVPWLSIIDVLMFNSVEVIQGVLKKYELT